MLFTRDKAKTETEKYLMAFPSKVYLASENYLSVRSQHRRWLRKPVKLAIVCYF